MRYAEGFEQLGARVFPQFAGLILLEAVKQTFAVKPKGLKAPARVFVPGALKPARVQMPETAAAHDLRYDKPAALQRSKVLDSCRNRLSFK